MGTTLVVGFTWIAIAIGISAWNSPKCQASLKNWRNDTRFSRTPEAIDTLESLIDMVEDTDWALPRDALAADINAIAAEGLCPALMTSIGHWLAHFSEDEANS